LAAFLYSEADRRPEPEEIVVRFHYPQLAPLRPNADAAGRRDLHSRSMIAATADG
jgi:hypothetical protein